MMNLSLINILLFMTLTWGTNIGLNMLYVLTRHFPIFISIDKPLDGKIKFFDKISNLDLNQKEIFIYKIFPH
jgi:hypothetical protein